MLSEAYPLESIDSINSFRFVSVGKQNKVIKIIQYQETDYENVYNIALADYNEVSKEVSDTERSGDGNLDKILSTVVVSVYLFTNQNPSAFIIVTGSTESRTRLYHMKISSVLSDIEADFDIFGFVDERWVRYDKNARYLAIGVARKAKNN